MNIGIDYHDTLSYHPLFFKELIKSWDSDIFIVTGTPQSYESKVVSHLTSLGFPPSSYKSLLMGYEYKKEGMTIEHFQRMRQHKLKLILDNNIQIYFDDNPYYVEYIKESGILTFMLCVDNSYMSKFAIKDPFFTCHLQNKMFDFLKNLQNKDVVKKQEVLNES